MSYTDILQDHSVLRRALDILDAMVKRMEDGKRIEIFDVTTILDFLRRFGNEHQSVEEKRVLIARVDDALLSRKGTVFVRNSRQLTVFLRSHFNKDVESPANRTQPELCANLALLERKYTPQPYVSALKPGRAGTGSISIPS